MDKPVILCVDDELMVLKSLKAELMDAFGDRFEVELAETGEDAIELLEELEEDEIEVPLVIVDYIMPDMKGDKLLEQLHIISPDTLKIMLTGYSSIEGVAYAINHSQLYRYMAKPWENKDLILTVSAAVDKYFQTKKVKAQSQKLEEQNALLLKLNDTLEEKIKKRTEEIRNQKTEIENQARFLAEKNEEISSQKENLEQLNGMKDKIFSIISHDFRNPLHSLQGSLKLLGKGMISPEELPLLATSLNSKVNSTANLLENLLSWATSQMNGLTLKPAKIDLEKITMDVIDQYSIMLEDKAINLEKNFKKVNVWADYHTTQLIIRNLLSNAIKFTPYAGKISIEATKNNGFIEYSIQDTGVGIPSNKLATLFKLHFSNSTLGTNNEKGTGLGLTLCKEFVELNHGKIWVTSTEGEGSKFTFSLPIKEL